MSKDSNLILPYSELFGSLSCAQHHIHGSLLRLYQHADSVSLNPFYTATVCFMHGPNYWCRLDYQVPIMVMESAHS